MMKKLTREEFRERVEAVGRARKIFIPHLTKSITLAFEIYCEILAEKEYAVRINKYQDENYTKFNAILKYIPRCPECGKPLMLRAVMLEGRCPQTRKKISRKSNRYGWKTCLECSSEVCFYEKYSTKDLADWAEELEKKKGEDDATVTL